MWRQSGDGEGNVDQRVANVRGRTRRNISTGTTTRLRRRVVIQGSPCLTWGKNRGRENRELIEVADSLGNARIDLDPLHEGSHV